MGVSVTDKGQKGAANAQGAGRLRLSLTGGGRPHRRLPHPRTDPRYTGRGATGTRTQSTCASHRERMGYTTFHGKKISVPQARDCFHLLAFTSHPATLYEHESLKLIFNFPGEAVLP